MSTDGSIETVDEAFAWFEKNVARVDDEENKDAKEVHPDVRQAVSEAMPVAHHFLSGSYGRRVQAVKLKDIDVIVVLDDDDDTYWHDARGTLLEIQDALRACELVRQARPPSVRSVKALPHDYEFHVDAARARSCRAPLARAPTSPHQGAREPPAGSAGARSPVCPAIALRRILIP